jgi:hypothetical protein
VVHASDDAIEEAECAEVQQQTERIPGDRQVRVHLPKVNRRELRDRFQLADDTSFDQVISDIRFGHDDRLVAQSEGDVAAETPVALPQLIGKARRVGRGFRTRFDRDLLLFACLPQCRNTATR